jgi:hypothetical protein
MLVTQESNDIKHPDIVDGDADAPEPDISQPTKLIRMASMTRAMLEEVRQAPTDEPGRRRLLEIHERSLNQLRDVISSELRAELNDIFLPLAANEETPTESEIRIAQAQLVGWLEGLFHGIQASLFSQQVAAQTQLAEMRHQGALEPGSDSGEYSGTYL